MKHLRFMIAGVLLIMVFAWKFAPPVKATSSTNLSAYEFLIGTNCTIDNVAGTCGVLFSGWTGGGGPVANGWIPFPGTNRGSWNAQINYTGSPAFGGSVAVQSGHFGLSLKGQPALTGTVTGGTVTWPASRTTDSGCGKGVALVFVAVSTGSGDLYFHGCLHDLPAGTVIPPKIWGTLESNACSVPGLVKPNC